MNLAKTFLAEVYLEAQKNSTRSQWCFKSDLKKFSVLLMICRSLSRFASIALAQNWTLDSPPSNGIPPFPIL